MATPTRPPIAATATTSALDEEARGEGVPPSVVWQRAVELAGAQQEDVFSPVVELLHAARHDLAAVFEALKLGQAEVRTRPSDLSARRAVRILGQSAGFLGAEDTPWSMREAGALPAKPHHVIGRDARP